MTQTMALCSEKGDRETNEDKAALFKCGDITAAVVSDGLGGHAGGELASETVADTVKRCFCINPELTAQNIEKIMEAANRNVLELHRDGSNMRATVAAAFISDGKIIIAHAGDSRVYVFGRLGILHETKDHSVPRMAVDAGMLKKKDIRSSPDRNKVLRSVGSEDYRTEITELEMPCGKIKGILLCTDGFWQNVRESDMKRTLRKSSDAHDWLDRMLQIHRLASEEDKDNYSAVAIKYGK